MIVMIDDKQNLSIADNFCQVHNTVVFPDTPIENLTLLDGQLYDNRELDYWKVLKTKENGVKFYTTTETPFEAKTGFFIKPNQATAEIVNLKKTGVELNETKGFEPYLFDINSKKHVMTKDGLLQVCRNIRDVFEGAYHAYMTNAGFIDEAKTVEQIKTIVI